MEKEDSLFNYKFMLPDGNELSMNLLFVGPAFFFSGAIAYNEDRRGAQNFLIWLFC